MVDVGSTAGMKSDDARHDHVTVITIIEMRNVKD